VPRLENNLDDFLIGTKMREILDCAVYSTN
jgi:hypothetical protein